jgi:LPXTG-site transpeptidase (sortase) family protein
MTLTQPARQRASLLVAVEAEADDRRNAALLPHGANGNSNGPAVAHEGPAPSVTHDSLANAAWFVVVRSALLVLALVALGLVFQLTVVSGLQHRASQVALFNRFRTELSLGTAPRGPVGPDQRAIALGTPIALLRIPVIGVDQVVVEGTSSAVLTAGPGHYVSTVFPGGTGTSVLLGRAAAYGGPFGRLHDLRRGDRITVITQAGTSVFRVVDVRSAGSRVRPVAAGAARLTLDTAAGSAFVPNGVLWVDADKIGAPLAAQDPLVAVAPANQRPLATDTSTAWELLLLLEALTAVVAGAVWTWRRRGHVQAWIVFFAPLVLLSIVVADQVTRLLPNLL